MATITATYNELKAQGYFDEPPTEIELMGGETLVRTHTAENEYTFTRKEVYAKSAEGMTVYHNHATQAQRKDLAAYKHQIDSMTYHVEQVKARIAEQMAELEVRLNALPSTYTPVRIEAPRKSVKEVLLHAAAYIEEHGWTQGRFQDPYGSACLVGALQAVVPPGQYGTLIAAREQVARLTGGRPEKWNDKPGRTQQQVVAILRVAAELP